MKEPVNFYFKLKWFLCNGYSEKNQAEVVLSLVHVFKSKTIVHAS